MKDTDDDTLKNTSAHSSLDGYFYQLKVSVLFALDLLASKKQTDQIILEPASEEDLEAEFTDEPSALTQGMAVKTKKLIIQCKQRSTGPWKIGNLASLLAHGKRRKSAKKRLKDPNIHYLLVTSADLDGVARNLSVSGPSQWSHLKKMPKTISKVLPLAAEGRVAVWNCLDQERVEYRIKNILTDRFRVPSSKLSDCIEELEEGALTRMRGTGGGIWTRDDVIHIIDNHGGYDGLSKDLQDYVQPTNWKELKVILETQHAIVITGPSGTGKTTTAKALVATLREANTQMEFIKVNGGPEQIRNNNSNYPVIYEIEDPWGKYRVEPTALPWNDEINTILKSASTDRKFVVTTRSDVLGAAGFTKLDARYTAKLLGEHYRNIDRLKLFDNRMKTLPRGDQASIFEYKDEVIKNLLLPLEIDRFFGSVGLRAKDGESQHTFIHRCIDEAKQEFIEKALIMGIKERDDFEQAVIIWALIKARRRITFDAIDELEPDLYSKLPALEDKLIPFINFLIAGGNLKQNETEISYTHPRVEAGLESAALEKKNMASRVIRGLIEALIDLDDSTGTDWGIETAVNISAMVSRTKRLSLIVSKGTQERIDNWLTKRLGSIDSTFRDDLTLAIKTGSKNCAVAELARWLDDSPVDRKWFNLTSWKEPERTQEWYDWISTEPHTHSICVNFIQNVLGYKNGTFRGNFHQSVAKLSQNLTPAFRVGVSNIVDHGYNSNSGTLIDGALVDIEAFECVLSEAADVSDKYNCTDNRKFQLAIHNNNFDDYASSHYMENAVDDGHTAVDILDSYVRARRSKGEWRKLADHPKRNSFIWLWIDCLEKDSEFEDAELKALGDATFNQRNEKQFWELTKTHFNQSLLGLLEERLKEGSPDKSLRANAAITAHTQAPSLIDGLFLATTGLSMERTLGLAMDICEGLKQNKESRTIQQSIITTYTAKLSNDVAMAIHLILGFSYAEPSTASIKILQSVPDSASPELNLAIAKSLVSYEIDVSSRIKQILMMDHEVTTENIELVTQSMELGVKLKNQKLTALGLKHEFARCRITAMNALFFSSSKCLSSTILEMRKDESSLVLKRLLDMLEEKPHKVNTDALIYLTLNTWTPDEPHDGYAMAYPIAEKASELLLAQTSLTNENFKLIIKSLNKTHCNDVKLKLLQSMVKLGSSSRRDRIMKIAIGKGQPNFQRLSAKAMYFQRDSLEKRQLDLITYENVTNVSPVVACWLVLILSLSSTDQRILLLAESLSTNRDRAVLTALICLATSDENRLSLNDAIINLLQANQRAALRETMENKDASDIDYLDDLGDVRTVEEVKSFFNEYFK